MRVFVRMIGNFHKFSSASPRCRAGAFQAKPCHFLLRPPRHAQAFLTLRSPCTAPMYRGLKQGDFNGWLTRSTTTWMMFCKPAGRRSFSIFLASARNPWINLHQWPIRRSNRYSRKRKTVLQSKSLALRYRNTKQIPS